MTVWVQQNDNGSIKSINTNIYTIRCHFEILPIYLLRVRLKKKNNGVTYAGWAKYFSASHLRFYFQCVFSYEFPCFAFNFSSELLPQI